jgi:hypothetical protein
VVSKLDSSSGRIVASYKNSVPGVFTVTAIRTLSAQQDGVLAFNYGVTEVGYSFQIEDGLYTGNIHSITSTISDHAYTLEISNIFGTEPVSLLVYDRSESTNGNVRTLLDTETYTSDMYFTQADVAANPILFSFSTSDYTGPDNTVQLNFTTLLTDVTTNELRKSGEPTYFVF